MTPPSRSANIPFSHLLRVGLGVSVVVIILWWTRGSFLGRLIGADATTYLLLLALIAVLGWAIWQARRQTILTLIYLGVVFTVGLDVLQRVLVLLVWPVSFSRPGPDGPRYILQVAELNHTLGLYIIILTLFLIGAWLVGRRCRRPPLAMSRESVYFASRYVIYILAYSSLAVILFLGSALQWRMGSEWQLGWIVRLFPISLYSWILMLFWLSHRRQLFPVDRFIIIGYFFLIAFGALLQGSRSGLLTVAMLFIISALVVKGNFRISRTIIVSAAIVVMTIGPVMWGLGSNIRSSGKYSLANVAWEGIPLKISTRLGLSFDNFILVTNNHLDQRAVERYVRPGTIAKVAVNGFILGELFTVDYESLSNLWGTLVYGDVLGGERRFHGEGWFAFGQFFVIGGQPLMFGLVFVWAMLATFILKLFWTRSTFFYLLVTSQVFRILFLDFFEGANIDTIISNLFFMMSYLLVLHLALSFINYHRHPITADARVST